MMSLWVLLCQMHLIDLASQQRNDLWPSHAALPPPGVYVQGPSFLHSPSVAHLQPTSKHLLDKRLQTYVTNYQNYKLTMERDKF